jgi:hypothetical protein
MEYRVAKGFPQIPCTKRDPQLHGLATPWIGSNRLHVQQVMPEPQPNSFSNISQGIPLRRTNRMPLRQARSGKRGRPPCGLGFGDGKRGSITSHKPLGTSAAVITSASPQWGIKLSDPEDRIGRVSAPQRHPLPPESLHQLSLHWPVSGATRFGRSGTGAAPRS